MPHVTSKDGVRIAFDVLKTPETPDVTPLFLVNGVASVRTDFSPLDAELSRTRPVVIIDDRGAGDSVVPHDRIDSLLHLDAMAEDVISIADALGYTQIDLLGFSMGGQIAARVVLLRPSLVRRLILASTFMRNVKSVYPEVFALPQSTPEQVAYKKQRMLAANYDADYISGPEVGPLLAARFEDQAQSSRPSAVILKQMDLCLQADIYDVVKKSKFPPTLIFHGRRDTGVDYSAVADILDAIPHAKLLPENDFGHVWNDYYTTDFWVRALSQFLDSH